MLHTSLAVLQFSLAGQTLMWGESLACETKCLWCIMFEVQHLKLFSGAI